MKLTFLFVWIYSILSVSSTVIGIDYGTDWLKVSVIKPGGQIETVLNRESKRKTNAVLNIRKGVRSFGVEASTLGMRFPETTYSSLKSLLGKEFTDKHTVEYKSLVVNELLPSSRSTVSFKHDEDNTYQVEELVANLLSHCRQQAENYADITVSGAVITVPSHFTQFERRALLDAADIAKLRVYSLINDQTAVAINYAVGKKFPKKEYHVFYDIGAGSTTASLVSFHSGSDSKQGIKNLVDLEVAGFHVDPTLGGNEIDRRLQMHLAEQFSKKNGLKDQLYQNARALARLQKEANRCKTILSANDKVTASVESLHDGIDFRLEVTRETLEGMITDLIPRVTAPLKELLKSTDISLDQVQSMVLFGGGVRVPMFQKVLQEYVGTDKIARNVDGDEAAVFGAVLHAAAVSGQFRLGQTFRIKDINSTPVKVWYTSESTGKKIETVLFTPKSVLGSKKVMTFKKTNDFEFSIDYDFGSEGIKPIAVVKVGGLSAAVEKYKDTSIEEPKVKIQLALDESGLLDLSFAKATFEIDKGKESLTDSVLGFFGKKDAKNETVEGEGEEVPQPKEEKEKEKEEDKEKKTSGRKIITETVDLTLDIDYKTVAPLSAAEKAGMYAKLAKMDLEDRERYLYEEGMNKLEAYIYKCKEMTWDDDLAVYATEEELEKLKSEAAEQGEWLEDLAEKVTVAEFNSRRQKLAEIAEKILYRRAEHEQRPSLLQKLVKEIESLSGLSENVQLKQNDTDITDKEVEDLKSSITASDEWVKTQSALQEALTINQDPVFHSKDIKAKLKDLKNLGRKYDLKKRTKIKERQSKSQPTNENEPEAADKPFTPEDLEELVKNSNLSKEELEKLLADLRQAKADLDSEKADPAKEAQEDREANDATSESQRDEL